MIIMGAASSRDGGKPYMCNFWTKQKLLKNVLLVTAICLVWPAGSCLAGPEEVPLPAHYPEAFTIVNCIERVDSDKILLGDSLYKYAQKIKYYAQTIHIAMFQAPTLKKEQNNK